MEPVTVKNSLSCAINCSPLQLCLKLKIIHAHKLNAMQQHCRKITKASQKFLQKHSGVAVAEEFVKATLTALVELLLEPSS